MNRCGNEDTCHLYLLTVFTVIMFSMGLSESKSVVALYSKVLLKEDNPKWSINPKRYAVALKYMLCITVGIVSYKDKWPCQ